MSRGGQREPKCGSHLCIVGTSADAEQDARAVLYVRYCKQCASENILLGATVLR